MATLTGLTAFASVGAASLYALGAALQIRSIWHSRALTAGTLAAIVVPALLLHATATYLQMDTEAGLYLGFFTAASLTALLMVMFLVLAAAHLPVQNLLLLVLPFGTAAVIGAQIGETGFEARQSLPLALGMHILFSILAYSILFMAACQSLLLAYQDHALKTKSSIRALRLLPPLESMEALLFSMLWTGIVTLTAAIATGFLFLDDLFGQRVVHHTVLAIASWVVYAVLLTGRHFFGWRSRTATYWTLIAFSLLVLGYFGSKFVLEILLETGRA
ncbi:MAG: cytochrome c biogenesis protein CcsA [Pseudomonadales bacterium]